MKKQYLLLLLLLPLMSYAQKSVDLDRFRFTVQYRSLPRIKLDSTYHTYNVEVEGTKMMQPLLEDLNPESSIQLEGWRKLHADGHLNVHVKLGDLLPGSLTVKERTETIKNGNGAITGIRTFYHQEMTYSFEASAIVSDFKGMQLLDQSLDNRNYQRIYSSPEFAIRHLAEGYFLLNSIAITKELYRDCVSRSMRSLSERLNENFGFNEVTVNDFMWIIDSRKHPEYAAHRKAFQQLTEVLFTMNASTPLDGMKEQLQPVIDYFEKIKKTYTSTSKHDRKIRYASYFNLAVLYFYLDDPQNMMKEASGLALNDFDAKDARGFEQTATWLKNLFQQNNIYSRHFPIDPSVYKGPYEKPDVTIK